MKKSYKTVLILNLVTLLISSIAFSAINPKDFNRSAKPNSYSIHSANFGTTPPSGDEKKVKYVIGKGYVDPNDKDSKNIIVPPSNSSTPSSTASKKKKKYINPYTGQPEAPIYQVK